MCNVVPLSFRFYTVYLPVRTQLGSWYVFCAGACMYNIYYSNYISSNGNGVISQLSNFATLQFTQVTVTMWFVAIVYVLYYICIWFIIYVILKQGFCPLNFCRNLITLISPLLQIRHSCFCIAPQTGATFHIPRSAYVKVIFLKVVGFLL